MTHQMMVVWVLDVAEKHMALVIAHKPDIRVFKYWNHICKRSLITGMTKHLKEYGLVTIVMEFWVYFQLKSCMPFYME